MTGYSNVFAGGTNGSAITGANSGGASGDAFTSVTQGNGVTFDNTHVYGTLPLACKIAAGSGISCPIWQPASAFSNGTFWLLLYFTANPSSATTVGGFYSGSTVRVRLSVSTTGKLTINSAAGGTATSTNSVPLNQFFLVEMSAVLAAGSGGSSTVNLYNTPTGSLTETFGQTAVNYGGTADRIRLGVGTAPAVSSPDFWIGAAKANDTGAAFGPLVTTTGSVALAVATTLAIAGNVEHDAPAALAVTFSLGLAAGQVEHDAPVALTVATGLAVAGTAEHDAAVPLAVATSLAIAATVQHPAAVPLVAAAVLAVAPAVEHDAPVGLAVATSLALGATVEHDLALLPLAVAVGLTLVGEATRSGAVTLEVATVLAVTAATRQSAAAVPLAVALSLAVAGQAERDAALTTVVATALGVGAAVEHDAALALAVDFVLAVDGARTLEALLPLLVAVAVSVAGTIIPGRPSRDVTVVAGPTVTGYAAGPSAGAGYSTGPTATRYLAGAIAGAGYEPGPAATGYDTGPTAD